MRLTVCHWSCADQEGELSDPVDLVGPLAQAARCCALVTGCARGVGPTPWWKRDQPIATTPERPNQPMIANKMVIASLLSSSISVQMPCHASLRSNESYTQRVMGV